MVGSFAFAPRTSLGGPACCDAPVRFGGGLVLLRGAERP